MIAALNHYAVSIAIVVLGLSGCSSPRESARGTSTAGTDPLSASSKRPEQDYAQAESAFGNLEDQLQMS